ncbi:hypothetical protein WR25_14070 [Diploscapter pachys]|uniref:Uncharacterized protein n=1 Tax=Diploscapter pachys TaxID=2018661 RepID=A0A2A2J6B9_9BILA|nr:hypothetical protein WR25_14070 [Diploscapter pachys]
MIQLGIKIEVFWSKNSVETSTTQQLVESSSNSRDVKFTTLLPAALLLLLKLQLKSRKKEWKISTRDWSCNKEPKDENGKVPGVVTTTQALTIIPTSTSTSTSVAMASSGNQINDG